VIEGLLESTPSPPQALGFEDHLSLAPNSRGRSARPATRPACAASIPSCGGAHTRPRSQGLGSLPSRGEHAAQVVAQARDGADPNHARDDRAAHSRVWTPNWAAAHPRISAAARAIPKGAHPRTPAAGPEHGRATRAGRIPRQTRSQVVGARRRPRSTLRRASLRHPDSRPALVVAPPANQNPLQAPLCLRCAS
jgi:hypothetical protein